MKKTLTLLLALLLVLPTLTACSTNEVTMLKMVNKMINVEIGEIDGTLTLKTPHAMEIEFNGEFDLEDLQNPYLNLTVDLDTKTPYARRIISGKILSDNNNLIISKNLVRTIKELQENKEYLTLFDKEYKDYEYILFKSSQIEDCFEYFKNLKGNLTIENINEISANLEELKPLKLVHMEEGDLIEFRLTPQNIEQATEIFTNYLMDNQKELVYETDSTITKNFLFNVTKSINDTKYIKTLLNKTYETDDELNSEIKQFIRNYNSFYSTELNENSKKYSNSYLTYIFGYNKYKKIFKHDISFKLNSRKEKIDISGMSNFTVKERTVNKIILNNNSIIEYFEIDVEKENNTPDTINITWKNNNNIAKIYTHYKKYDTSKEYDANYYIIEDRIYLPLRQICELLGLEVSWDDVEKKAYVTKGKNKVDMTGTIIGDRTFIKIRDFEKIDLLVSYTENGENKIATIKR